MKKKSAGIGQTVAPIFVQIVDKCWAYGLNCAPNGFSLVLESLAHDNLDNIQANILFAMWTYHWTIGHIWCEIKYVRESKFKKKFLGENKV